MGSNSKHEGKWEKVWKNGGDGGRARGVTGVGLRSGEETMGTPYALYPPMVDARGVARVLC